MFKKIVMVVAMLLAAVAGGITAFEYFLPTIPDVRRMMRAEAEQELRDYGFENVDITSINADEVPVRPGQVAKSIPPPGQRHWRYGEVKLRVAVARNERNPKDIVAPP